MGKRKNQNEDQNPEALQQLNGLATLGCQIWCHCGEYSSVFKSLNILGPTQEIDEYICMLDGEVCSRSPGDWAAPACLWSWAWLHSESSGTFLGYTERLSACLLCLLMQTRCLSWSPTPTRLCTSACSSTVSSSTACPWTPTRTAASSIQSSPPTPWSQSTPPQKYVVSEATTTWNCITMASMV